MADNPVTIQQVACAAVHKLQLARRPHVQDLAERFSHMPLQEPGAGRGVFAARSIAHGDTVLEEQPLVCTHGAFEEEQVRLANAYASK